ncbi:MAG TPA: RnfABCDGE type electron transport complex subunit D [Tepidiformaceae bacterium]|nr:RnfABCDGE type electron transport complex subunit D [Tepidiformaceae bacterium]
MKASVSRRPAPEEPLAIRKLKRFARTPKGTLIVIFVVLLTLAIGRLGWQDTLPRLGVAVFAAAMVDLAVVRAERREWIFPDGAILSGAIVAMLLSPVEHWYVVAATATLAVTTKHLFRVGPANVFNPAALAIVLSSVFFGSIQDWWGALPALGWLGIPILVGAGGFIADRINKLPMVLVFLGVYFSLFTAMGISGAGRDLAEIFRSPDVHMALFFAFFMLDDPPTCPVRYRHQVVYGAIVAVSCFAFFEMFGWVYFLPAGLLVGNAVEGGRRWLAQERRARLRAAPARAAA